MNIQHTSLIKKLHEYLINEFENNLKLVLLVADSMNSSKTGEVQKRFPERFIQMGISEQDMVGTAVGLSHEGFVPIIIAYTAYLIPRAFEQLRNHIGIDNQQIKLIGTHASFSAYNPGDRSYEDIALANTIDNLTILSPHSPNELEYSVRHMLSSKSSYYLRLHNGIYSFKDKEEIKSSPVCIKKGNEVAVFSYGFCLGQILQFSEEINVSIYSCIELNNFNIEYISKILSYYKKIIVVEDNKPNGGLYNYFLMLIREIDLPVKLFFLGIPPGYHQFGTSDNLQEELELTSIQLKNKIEYIIKK